MIRDKPEGIDHQQARLKLEGEQSLNLPERKLTLPAEVLLVE